MGGRCKVRRDLLKQIYSVADDSCVHQKSVRQDRLELPLPGEHCNVNKRYRSECDKGKDDPSLVHRFEEQCDGSRNTERNPSAGYESRWNKSTRSHRDRQQCASHQPIEPAKCILININVMERHKVSKNRRKAHHGQRNCAQLGRGAKAYDQRPDGIELLLDCEGPCHSQQPGCLGRNRNKNILDEQRKGPPW